MATSIPLPGGSLEWKGDELAESIKRLYAQRLGWAGEAVKLHISQQLGTPGAPPPATPSSPGEYPHKDTGQLIESLFVQIDERNLMVRVGSSSPYAEALEFGTAGGREIVAAPGKVLSWVDPHTGERKFARRVVLGPIAPRPFLRKGIDEMEKEVRALLELRIEDLGL